MTRDQIRAHQEMLTKAGFPCGQIDGWWGDKTERATVEWERATGHTFDRRDGNTAVPRDPLSPATDARFALHPPLSSSERAATFGGPFRWIHRPLPGNRENIEILDGWEESNIVSVEIPQLRKIPGNFHRMRWNKRAVEQLKALWDAWERAELLPLVLSYEGAYVPRLIRGSSTSLSNHAYGSAFDINYYWNQLGQTPAMSGRTGSVRELVPLAHKYGFFWGGNFSRLDGMHFEVCKIL